MTFFKKHPHLGAAVSIGVVGGFLAFILRDILRGDFAITGPIPVGSLVVARLPEGDRTVQVVSVYGQSFEGHVADPSVVTGTRYVRFNRGDIQSVVQYAVPYGQWSLTSSFAQPGIVTFNKGRT